MDDYLRKLQRQLQAGDESVRQRLAQSYLRANRDREAFRTIGYTPESLLEERGELEETIKYQLYGLSELCGNAPARAREINELASQFDVESDFSVDIHDQYVYMRNSCIKMAAVFGLGVALTMLGVYYRDSHKMLSNVIGVLGPVCFLSLAVDCMINRWRRTRSLEELSESTISYIGHSCAYNNLQEE